MFDTSPDLFPLHSHNPGRFKCESCRRRFDRPKYKRVGKGSRASLCPYCNHTIKVIKLKKGLVR